MFGMSSNASFQVVTRKTKRASISDTSDRADFESFNGEGRFVIRLPTLFATILT